jgi:phenylacetate-CoA ligase
VQDEYGCGEVGPIAYQCEQGRLHVMSENLLVEVLTEKGELAGPGQTGEIVVTDLNNRAMPLIRYRLGDFAVVGRPCSCGRGFPVLENIRGRAYDFVERADGRRYHGEFFMYLFEDLRSHGLPIGQFQITQIARRALEILVVTPESASAEVEARIGHQLGDRLPGMEVTVRRVESIPREASGKMRVIRSMVAKAGGTSA